MSTKLTNEFMAARRVSVPIVAVSTNDQNATIELLCQAMTEGSKQEYPIVVWDIVRGLRPRLGNASGEKMLAKLEVTPATSQNPVEMLGVAERFDKRTCLIMINSHMWLNEKTYIQAIWNLRDSFKVNGRTLVMMGTTFRLPPELEPDIILLDQALPTEKDLEGTIRKQYDNAGVTSPADDDLLKLVDAVTGLPSFTAEQATAMSMTRTGVDAPALWERKRQIIEQTPGLTVWRGGETFDQVGGCSNVKTFLRAILDGEAPPRAVVFIDEIEKMLAGAGMEGGGGDTSGTSQDQLGQLLSYMQDHSATGMIFIGPPGAAKSALAKATGNAAGIPTISLDLGDMKGSLVGESEARIRAALKVITAISGDKAMFIATCNSIGTLPPELRRRFTFGTFFFDLPTEDERRAIWDIYIKKYLSADLAPGKKTAKAAAGSRLDLPDDEGWTGAEIKQCCELAWRLNITLQMAATYIVPVSKSAGERIKRLRTQASSRFISASHPGLYKYSDHDALAEGGREYTLPTSNE